MIRPELHCAPDVLASWPSGENQLFQGNLQSPELTKLLLTSILSGKGKCAKRIIRLVHSIEQDLTYNSSMERKRTKKACLAWSERKTNNRLCRCCSLVQSLWS